MDTKVIDHQVYMLSVPQLTKMLEIEKRIVEKITWSKRKILPNEAIKGPMARASACKLLNVPKIVPFSLAKPYFDAKLLMTLITILEAKWLENKTKINFFFEIFYQLKKVLNQSIRSFVIERSPIK